jgi:hypothetical protein
MSFDPETANADEIAKFFLERSANFMTDGGSYAIAYALLMLGTDHATIERIEGDIRTLYGKWTLPPELKAAIERRT